jgi:hypothetical protein
MTDLDFTGMNIADREAFRVGDLTAPLRNPDYVSDPANPDGYRHYYRADIPAADLLKLAEVAKWMLYEAIWIADDQNNAQFFEEAFSLYGPLVSAAMQEMSLRDRSTLTGRVEDPLVKCSGCGHDQYLHRTTCPVCHRSAPGHCL